MLDPLSLGWKWHSGVGLLLTLLGLQFWVLNTFLTPIVEELDKENPIACGRRFSQVTL
ncbi:transmembrane protein, putative [Medicago truncatula]|uniref:Transmembrane protein, putative n=1 Tax=Medicago truncatula TaxID=3880 RepID=A0A072UBJ0_MEDTR|nr:transmembrane protein, putative [Medicago truncatula]